MRTLIVALLVTNVAGCTTAVLREPEIDITDSVRACKGHVKIKKFVVDSHKGCSCKSNITQTNTRIKTYFGERPLYRKMHRFAIWDNPSEHERGKMIAIVFVLCDETSIEIKQPAPAMEIKE
jgi:hypothetical protein